MDEIKLGIAQQRGGNAALLLESELLKEVFKGLEETYLQAWRSTKALDTTSREKLWQAIQILGIVQEQLRRYVSDGRLAAADLNRLSEESTSGRKRKSATY